jgi:hypothetical protein
VKAKLNQEVKDMFLVSTVTYPPEKATEIVTRYINRVDTPVPPFLKRVNSLLAAGGEEGCKILTIYEVDDGNVADGVRELVRHYLQYRDVEGFRYRVEPMLTVEEAIPLLGL